MGKRTDDGDPFNIGWNACFDKMNPKNERLRQALKMASEKLKIYRSATDGSYTGGMEYTALMYLIEAALAEH